MFGITPSFSLNPIAPWTGSAFGRSLTHRDKSYRRQSCLFLTVVCLSYCCALSRASLHLASGHRGERVEMIELVRLCMTSLGFASVACAIVANGQQHVTRMHVVMQFGTCSSIVFPFLNIFSDTCSSKNLAFSLARRSVCSVTFAFCQAWFYRRVSVATFLMNLLALGSYSAKCALHRNDIEHNSSKYIGLDDVALMPSLPMYVRIGCFLACILCLNCWNRKSEVLPVQQEFFSVGPEVVLGNGSLVQSNPNGNEHSGSESHPCSFRVTDSASGRRLLEIDVGHTADTSIADLKEMIHGMTTCKPEDQRLATHCGVCNYDHQLSDFMDPSGTIDISLTQAVTAGPSSFGQNTDWRSTADIHVFGMDGEKYLDVEMGNLQVCDVTSQLAGIVQVPQYQIVLIAETSDSPLLDSEFLLEVQARSVALDRNAPLKLVMLIEDELCARGPFALGQDATWGQWETMSDASGPLSVLQGKWKRQSSAESMRCYTDILDFCMDACFDEFGQPVEVRIRNGLVSLKWRGFPEWRLEFKDGLLLASVMGRRTVHTYVKVA